MTINVHPEHVDLSEYHDPYFVLLRLPEVERAEDQRPPEGRVVLYRGEPARVVSWSPLSAALTDALLSFLEEPSDSERKLLFVSLSDCRPVDGMGSLPSRRVAVARNREESKRSLERVYRDHVQRHLSGERWPGLDFGRAHVGTMLERAIEDAGGEPKTIVEAAFAEKERKAAE